MRLLLDPEMDSAVVGWTGRGSLADLARSARRVLAAAGADRPVRRAAGSVIVDGPEPTEAASLLRNMPGVAWVAVGHAFGSRREAADAISELAAKYLRRGKTFAVVAGSSDSQVTAGDLVGSANSAVLDAVRGVRVDEREPDLTFRVLLDGKRGVAAVELHKGAGGTPMAKEWVRCLVSGGMHSSVMAWTALLSGMRVELHHAFVGDAQLRDVARLYAELSHRVDPSGIRLAVSRGGSVRSLLRGQEDDGLHTFAGAHAECPTPLGALSRKVRFPLYLMPEERFRQMMSELELKGNPSREGWKRGPPAVRIRTSRFGGRRSDLNGVLDGLR